MLAEPLNPIGDMPETLSVRQWVVHGSTFDNFFEAVITLNEVNSFQEWPNTAWLAVDSSEVNQAPIEGNNLVAVTYFMLFIIISQYMFMNLFIGVIFTSFAQVKAKQSGKNIMTRRQMCWLHICQMIASSKPVSLPPKPPGKYFGSFRRMLYTLILSSEFDFLIQGCIVANVITLAMTHHGETGEMTLTLQTMNTVFTLIFMAEALIKIVAIDFKQYWNRGWNRLDFVLVVVSGFDLFVVSNIVTASSSVDGQFDSTATVRAMGALRVLRVFRLVRKSRQVMQLFQMIRDSIGYFANAILVYILLLIMFAILAMNLFGTVNRGSYLHDRANFETFGLSMLTLFRAASTDDWNELSYGAGLQTPHCEETIGNCGNFWLSRAFFFVFNVVMSLIFMNLLAAVFLGNFDDIEMKAKYRVNSEDLKKFQHSWVFYDPSGTGWVSLCDLPALLRDVGPPIGIPQRAQDSEVVKLLRSAKLKVPNGGNSLLVGDTSVLVKSDAVGYYDLLFALCWRCCGVKMQSNEMVNETMVTISIKIDESLE